MTVQLPYPATIFGISIHGVLPLSLLAGFLHVPDRNLLSRIQSIRNSDADRYWIDQLNSAQVTINPIFTAAEGIGKRPPTRNEFVEQYFAAEKLIKKHLPAVNFIPHTEKTLAFSYALLEDLEERRARETEFLLKAAPLVATRHPAKCLLEKEQEILVHAAEYGMSGGSLTLLAALSCLYESSCGTPTSPGRGVLKPTAKYTAANAHNCLSDLLALELIVAASSLGIGDHAFITADKNLGRFWQALDARAAAPKAARGAGTFKITNKLLQRIDEAGLSRLENYFSSSKS